MVALTAIALFAVVGQSAVQYSLTTQISTSSIVNISGKQRMLSQRAIKNLLLITDSSTLNKQIYLDDLEKILPLWQSTHEGLKAGELNLDTKIIVNNSKALNTMLADIDPVFYRIYNNIELIKNRIDKKTFAVDDTIKKSMQIILNNELIFLKKQDKIVFQYDIEAKAKVESLKKMEFSLLAFTIIVLVLEGLFVFRPAVRYIRRTIKMLIQEENKTKLINEELSLVNASLKEAKMELLDAEKEKLLQQVNEQRIKSISIVQGQEEERKRIAKELHDGIGQLLTTLKMTFENINSESFELDKEKRRFREGKELIQDTINEIRNISFNLMPSVLSDFGIASALKLLCNQTAHNTIKMITFKDSRWIPIRLEKNVEIGLYRIAQEALNNAIKYSEADEITIELGRNEDMIELSIIDDGKGFHVNATVEQPAKDTKRNGLSNMEERAEMIGGTVSILSNDGIGTTVKAIIPLQYEQQN